MKKKIKDLNNILLLLIWMITTIFFYGCNTIAGTARGLGEDIKKTFGYIGKNNENKD